jgi:hypothetical protein
MSNYHYYDQEKGYKYSYTNLKHIDEYECNQHCLCRETNERSDKDKLYYDFYVLNKSMSLKPDNPKNKQEKENYCFR